MNVRPLALAVALLGAALGTGGCRRESRSEAPTLAQKAVRVEAVTVDERLVPKTLLITGSLESDQRTELSANASGRVVRTFVERGDHVKAGAIVAQLDSRTAASTEVEARANAKSIEEQLAAVRVDCARYEGLLAKGAIAQADYDRQASQCRTQAASEEAARARASEAARALHDTGIRAPFAGVIGERYVNIGDYVMPSSRVVTLLVDDPLRLKVTVPEPMVEYAKEGTVVTFAVTSFPGRTFTATIKYLGREIRPTTRDIVDEAVVDNHEHLLLPGMFATVQLSTGTAPMPVVPKTAIVPTEAGPTVFVVVDGRLQQRAVHAGAPLDDVVVPVSEGLKKGERVVKHPSAETVDGSPVE
jgi:membrane fusion protein (multidrug efflux system)